MKTGKPKTKPTYRDLERENRRWRAAAIKLMGLYGFSPKKVMSNMKLRNGLKTVSAIFIKDNLFIQDTLRDIFHLQDDELADPCELVVKAGVIIESANYPLEKLRTFANTSAEDALKRAMAKVSPGAN
jgi:hypothetical protein